MGKGTIYSGGSKGRYVVSLDYGTSLRDDLLAVKTDRKAAIEAQITAQESAVTAQQTALDTANVSLNSAIATYNASPKADTDKTALTAYVDAKNSATTALRKANTVLGQLELQLAQVDYDIAELNSLDLTENKTVWCADYTEGANGDVAIIEINAEQPTFVIAPGCEAYSFAWGQMIARELMTGPQAYYNDAILPGVQKYRPTFRSGVILSLDYDNSLCSVRLDDAVSSAQNLDINTATTLDNVPVTYMACDCYAFEPGDKVVVYFQGQSPDQPVVIGFVTNPRQCGTEEVWFLVEVAERVLDPGTPRGDKVRGAPFVFSTISSPYPGLSVSTGRTYGSEYAGVSLFPPTEPTGDFDPAAEDGYVDTLRIRFDVGWKKDFGADALFVPYTGVDVTSHAAQYDMVPSGVPPGSLGGYGSGGGFLGTDQHYGRVFFILQERWTDAASASLHWWIPEWQLNGQYVSQAYLSSGTTPCWTGTTNGSESYEFQGWTGQPYAANANLVANDLDHASEWLLQYYTPPPTITLDVGGTPTVYEFVRIGGAPRCANTLQTVPIATPESLGEDEIYDTNGEYELAVIYRVQP